MDTFTTIMLMHCAVLLSQCVGLQVSVLAMILLLILILWILILWILILWILILEQHVSCILWTTYHK